LYFNQEEKNIYFAVVGVVVHECEPTVIYLNKYSVKQNSWRFFDT